MSNYTKTTNFAAKDSLPSGNAAKIVKGTEIDTEFNNIATASATKANTNNAALTGTTTFETISDGTIAITAFVDEDNMASDSATLLPTQQSVKAYVDSQVTAQDLDVTDGSTSIDIDLDSESLGILGGTGIDSTASGTGVTLAIDSTVATLTGSQTLSNKTLSTPVVSGNLTTDGLLDGRDVAADGTKLDGIESGATADQTAAEIKTAYESNANTNAFTDADESKLDGIEASADVTDTANVTAAGALMDSELTSEASVKALNQGVATTDSPTFAGVTAPVTGNVTGNLTGNVTGNVTGDVTGDLTGDVTGNVTGNLTGSVLTAAQTNITSVGDLTDLDVAGDLEVFLVDGLNYPVFNVDVSTKRVGLLNASPDVTLDVGSATDAVHVPTGTTAQRPTGAAGYFRYNSSLEQFEGYTDAWGAIGGGGGSNLVSDTMTGDGVDTTLTLSNDPLNENNTQVYIDGVYQNKDTYSVSGTTLTFSTAPPNGSAVEAMTIQPTAVNVPADASVTPAKIASGDFYFDTDTLHVDATNNRVGVGTSSPSEALTIASAGKIKASRSDNTRSLLLYTDNNAATVESDTDPLLLKSADRIAFETAGTERMRLDSGNLLVGTTTINGVGGSSSPEGVVLDGNNAQLTIGTSSDVSATFNRQTTDGNIVQFRKDGSIVGSIGSYSGSFLKIQSAGNQSGTLYGTSAHYPLKNDALSDGVIDIGDSSNRFKDLWLSGGVVFGNTGGAVSSKTLDDYEEGTWTPVTKSGATTLTTTVGYAKYVKIGSLVYVTAYVTRNDGSSLTGSVSIQGLPFQVAAGSSQMSGSIWFDNVSVSEVATNYFAGGTSSFYAKEVAASSDYVTADQFDNGRPYYVSGVYQVAF